MKLSSKRKRKISSVPECSICLRTFTEPKVLPCGHTFCLNCLLRLPCDADRITCQQCRKQHTIPDEGLQQFADNFVVISMLNVSSSQALKSDCEACGENGHNEFCSHCQKVVCEKCSVFHKASVVKIETHIEMMSKMFCTPATVNKISKNAEKWQTSLENNVGERIKMHTIFTSCIKILESRRLMFDDYFGTLEKVHNIFLRCTDLQAGKLYADELREELMTSVTNCTNTRELTVIKSSVAELLELSQLMIAMETGDKFSFVAGDISLAQLFSAGGVTLGGNQLEIRETPRPKVTMPLVRAIIPSSDVSSYTHSKNGESVVAGDQSCNEEDHAVACSLLPETRCLHVNYMHKGSSTTVIPLRPVIAGRSFIRCPPGAAYCSQTNRMLVADNGNKRIMSYKMNGRSGRHFVSQGSMDCGEYKPWDIATSQSGRVFVADGKNQRVLVFTYTGDYVTSFGSHGTGDDQFDGVGGITCHNGCVLACDSGNQRVSMFTEDGKFIRHIASRLSTPQFVAAGRDDTIYVTSYGVADDCHGNVHVYRWDGTPVRQFGDSEGAGGIKPGGVTVDHQGYVCVAWRDHHRVDVYNPQGELHATFGKRGGELGELSMPLGLELLPDGRLVVCDCNNHRLQIF